MSTLLSLIVDYFVTAELIRYIKTNTSHTIIFFSMQFGSGKKLGAVVGCQPTYVYPPSLKKVARKTISSDRLMDSPDPTHAGVIIIS